jgi:hypothetical protein
LKGQISDALREAFDNANSAKLLSELFGKIWRVIAELSTGVNFAGLVCRFSPGNGASYRSWQNVRAASFAEFQRKMWEECTVCFFQKNY